MIDKVVVLLNPSWAALEQRLSSALPLPLLRATLLQMGSIVDEKGVMEGRDEEEGGNEDMKLLFAKRLVREIIGIGVETFVQKLKEETILETCSFLDLSANEEQMSQLQLAMEEKIKAYDYPRIFMESLEIEILERYCEDLLMSLNSVAPKREIEEMLDAEILLLGLEGMLKYLDVPILRDYYTALKVSHTVPIVLKKTQLIEEIILHAFGPTLHSNDGLKIKSEPIESCCPSHNATPVIATYTHSSPSHPLRSINTLTHTADMNNGCETPLHIAPSMNSPPHTPYNPPTSTMDVSVAISRQLHEPPQPASDNSSFVDINRTTPRKELEKMYVRDLRKYLQSKGLKYDDKRSTLVNRILKFHRSDVSGPPTPMDSNDNQAPSSPYPSLEDISNNKGDRNARGGSSGSKDDKEENVKTEDASPISNTTTTNIEDAPPSQRKSKRLLSDNSNLQLSYITNSQAKRKKLSNNNNVE